MITVDIAIVGAGPAGLCAATEASSMGASVLVLDEYSQPGGQYFRQPAPGLNHNPEKRLFSDGKQGPARLDAAKKAGARFLSDTLVWGAFSDGTVAIYSGGHCEVVKPAKLVLATGAHERPVAFPGWTLPGVITAGAAQALLKGQGILPGHRILMAGTGPLQIAVAAQLVQAGANLVGVLEGSKAGGLLGSGHRFWGQWDRLGEGIQYYRALRSARVPVLLGRTVVCAAGDPTLQTVTIAELDDNWRPLAGTEFEMEADTLCLGFGLIPSTRLARLVGCELSYDQARGGYAPVHDDSMQTSKEGVFVAGEAAGVAGARAAELQGRIAGISAALQLGKGDAGEARKRLESASRDLRPELRFARSLNEQFAPRDGILDIITAETIVCRCEEITAGQLRARPDWITDMNSARTHLRVGMGTCQGTMCETLVATMLAKEAGKVVDQVGHYHIRPPLKPIPVGALANLAADLPLPPERMQH